MMLKLTLLALLIAVNAQNDAILDAVCAGSSCRAGKSAVAAGVRLALSNSVNSTVRSLALLPGIYAATTPIEGSNQSLGPFLGPSALAQAQQGFLYSSPSASLTNSALAILYSSPLLHGDAQVITTSASTQTAARSLLLSSALVIDLTIGSNPSIPIYDGIADTGNLPLAGRISIQSLEGSTCSAPCSVGGSCGLDGRCICQTGFAGATCSDCAPGFFGPTCQACSCGSASCSDGSTGTGVCAAAVNASAAACGCLNGLCTSSTICSCSAGWADAPAGLRCSVPAPGFALSNDTAQVTVCSPGCTSCTANRCTTCDAGLQLSSTNPSSCEPTPFLSVNSTSTAFATCQAGTFNAGNGACVTCDPACATCYGVGNARCLRCTAPRMLLRGQCVNVDAATGVCDKSGSAATVNLGANAAFVADTARDSCDAIPANCTAASIPSFSLTSARTDLRCTACLPGTALSDGSCVSSCSIGQFAASTGNSTAATCTTCDSSCASCSATGPRACTACPAGALLQPDGSCLVASTCPASTFLSTANSTSACLPCSAECATCDSSPTSCLACPPSRPALVGGRCLTRCPKGRYLANGSCQACSASCASCIGPGTDQCLSCDTRTTLRAGRCEEARCAGDAETIAGLGVCLEALLTLTSAPLVAPSSPSNKSTIPLGALLAAIIVPLFLLALFIFCLRRRQIRKRREKTREFGRAKNLEAGNDGRIMNAVRRARRKLQKREATIVPADETTWSAAEKRDPFPPVYTVAAVPVRPPRPASLLTRTESSRSQKNPFLARLERPTSEVSVAFTVTSPMSPAYPPRPGATFWPVVREREAVV